MSADSKYEIERKFKINKLPEELCPTRVINIQQAYISTDPAKTIRIRLEELDGDEWAYLTIKGKNEGATRIELQTPIDYITAEEMIENFSVGNVIKKTRYVIPYADGSNLNWELDQFHGECEGLWLVEIELRDENQKIEIPSWVGKEVTNDYNYSCSSLSQTPLKE